MTLPCLLLLLVGCPSGMYLLQSLPTGVPKPEAFIQGSRAMLEQVTKKIEETYHSEENRSVSDEWVTFRDEIAPQSDLVEEHITAHPEHWRIPLRNELFDGVACSHGEHIPARARKSRSSRKEVASRQRDRVSEQLDYVQWGRRGQHRQKNDPARKLPNIVVDGPPDVHFSVPVSCRSKKATASTNKRSADRMEPGLTEHLPPIGVYMRECVNFRFIWTYHIIVLHFSVYVL